ncbi:MAG: hypothetical protein RE471_00975 [Ferroplasma sp.]|uniref:hypothetical protein n=1 Tax=Ferroplasma sp. TaxID=2591003 RepID=UPI002815DDDE|nr:hypothetical protein [Ferroplasma sp.]WMT51469.1 MAG: hypothetical protein RE471_00975 [Ferroplasma sp.]
MTIREFLTRHNRLFIPLIAILYALMVFSVSIYYAYLFLLIFTIPVVMFLLMHFLGMYKFKPRLFGGIVILLVVLIIAGGMYSTYFYDLNGKESKDINGTSLNIDISPFSGVDKNYNFTVTTNYTGSLNGSYLYIYSGGTYSQNITYSKLNHTEKNGITTIYYDTKLPSGLYDTNYTIAGNITITTAGPVNVGRLTFYEFYVFALADEYIASIGVLYVIGIALAYFMSKRGIVKS